MTNNTIPSEQQTGRDLAGSGRGVFYLSRHLTAGTGKPHENPCKDGIYNKMNTWPSSSKPSYNGSVEKAQEARVVVTAECGRTARQRLPTEMFADRRKQKE